MNDTELEKKPMLSNLTLINVAFRSFFLQASWNYRGMMSMGLLFSLSPALDKIYKDDIERERAYMRHFEYFNTNPYFSPVVMGVILSLEERFSRGEIDQKTGEELIHDTKEGLMTACAAIGDGLFWDSWRPFVAVLSLVFASNNFVLTPLFFLILYNIPHLYFRFAGIFWGYREGTHVIKKLKQFQFPIIRQKLKYGTLILLAYLIPNYLSLHTPFLIMYNMKDWYNFGEKIIQGLLALGFVTVATIGCRSKLDVLLISFLLMLGALVLNRWQILI